MAGQSAVGPSVINRGRGASAAAAGKGLGRAAAEELAREGVHVAICAHTASTIEEAAAKVEKSTGHEVLRKTLDVTDSAAVAAFVEGVEACFGRIDICVTTSGDPPSKWLKSTRREDTPAALECDRVQSLLQCDSNRLWMTMDGRGPSEGLRASKPAPTAAWLATQ